MVAAPCCCICGSNVQLRLGRDVASGNGLSPEPSSCSALEAGVPEPFSLLARLGFAKLASQLEKAFFFFQVLGIGREIFWGLLNEAVKPLAPPIFRIEESCNVALHRKVRLDSSFLTELAESVGGAAAVAHRVTLNCGEGKQK